jgi:hypothetical protein
LQYGRGPLLEALEIFLQGAAGRLRFVTLPDLLASGRPIVEEWSPPNE